MHVIDLGTQIDLILARHRIGSLIMMEYRGKDGL